MQIHIMDLQNKVRLEKTRLTRCAEFVLSKMGEEEAEVSLVFTTDSHIKRLNRKYRKVNSETDVLAFSMREGRGEHQKIPILGDVVISTQTAEREAKRRKVSIQKEISLYLVHGILHLLGYDDKRACDRKRMDARQAELLEAM